ncbi:RNA polymerase sigma factor [Candidatus Magnetominusculus xianensis]|uniref:RNA polymerase, sigma-24 subunit, ECF subfamily n=1 Tax=Candidatus Magnetominusculus xianensis TaxID=1748249 RepID=A0ABR5SL72_9BACT|nr:RNA polymerase sigma factor [Candidatus Magnetominusculus xianensis]KWT91083.1 RNA polymerase, sigma-24 subunit, ECF subfamily [Candidatus Magnetominusculus xianensis]MBF0403272.1 RNA polymerase sigma factor [Nitrospirota bacterium]
MPDTHSDDSALQELIGRIIAGDTDEFEVIVRRYSAYVFKIAASYIPQEAVSEAAQEVFVSAFEGLASFNGKSQFKYWLRTITVRTCYDFWRTHYKSRELPVSSLGEVQQGWFQRVINEDSMGLFRDSEMQRDTVEILNWAMAGLAPIERMLITLVYLEGYSVKEAAQMLNLSTINVKVKALRAKAKLRKKILNNLKEGVL